jgi:hypothetical protein
MLVFLQYLTFLKCAVPYQGMAVNYQKISFVTLVPGVKLNIISNLQQYFNPKNSWVKITAVI